MEVSGKKTEMDEGGNVEEPVMDMADNGEEPERVCESCKIDNITTQANGFCRECEEHMCNACFKYHLRGKLCRHHVLVESNVSPMSIAEKKEDALKCTQHNGETVRFYCRKHEVVGCGDCIIFEHKACKSEYINDVSKSFQQKEEFKTLMSKIENLTCENIENENTVKEKQSDNKLMLEEVLGDIRTFRLDINNYLDEVEANLISEAKLIMSENDKLLAELEQDCKLLSSKIDQIKHMLNTEVFKENELFINTVKCKPNVSDIEKTIAEIQSKKTKTANFVCDEQFRSIVNSAKKLGSFDISTTTLRPQTTQSKEKETGKIERNSDRCYESTEKEVPMAVVGARVRHNDHYTSYLFGNGTVTDVHPDGRVNVKWNNGDTDGPYTVGTGYSNVRLI